MKYCEICQVKLSSSKEGYKTHLANFHALKPQDKLIRSHSTVDIATLLNVKQTNVVNKIEPVRTTNRSKAQIVKDMEMSWGYAVIPMVKPWSLTKAEVMSLGGR